MTEQSQPACRSRNVPSYLAGAKDGAALGAVAGGQSLKPRCSCQVTRLTPSPLCPPCPAPLTLQRSLPTLPPLHHHPPGFPEACLPHWYHLLPYGPVGGGGHPPPLLLDSGSAEGECGGLGRGQHPLFWFIMLYFTMFASSRNYPPVPLSVRQYLPSQRVLTGT